MNRLLLRTKARLRDAAKPVGGSRRRRADDRAVAHDALFRSDQDRQFLRPRHPLHRPQAARGPDRPRKSHRRLPGKIAAKRSKPSWPASGTISAASAPNSPISITSGTTTSIIRKSRAASSSARGPSRLFDQLRDDGKPALIFASHLGNWEIPALGAVAHGLDCAILFRRPNIESADRAIERIRAGQDGHADPGRPRRAAQAGGGAAKRPARRDAGRSVSDQRRRGDVLRPQDQGQSDAGAAAAAGRMPRSTACASSACPTTASAPNCPKRSSRCATPQGQIDIQGTMQAVTSVIEGWVREYPDQWLWLHRRWR